MQVHTFIAASAAEAVGKIREQLGPEAVVLNVRKLPAEGISRLWQRPRIEVLAYQPEPPVSGPVSADALAEFRQELSAIRQTVEHRALQSRPPISAIASSNDLPFTEARASLLDNAGWRVGALLENTGLLPIHVQRVVEQLRGRHGESPPESLSEELRLTRAILCEFWPARAAVSQSNMHVFVGAPGVGKTTALCKWLAQSVLQENRLAQVWRLDGHVANTAESLSVYAEILGVPLERCRPTVDPIDPATMCFVDLPGVNWSDPEAWEDFVALARGLPPAEIHLVLNAAYELPILLAQARAFSALPVSDLILTHLDEEARWGKLWNLALGTNFTMGWLSAGQNIPGEFRRASAEILLERQFPCK